MTETKIAPLLRFFKALAHESRLRLLGFLAQRARTVQELASLLGLTEPTTSHHLGLLREAGLVSLRVEGNLKTPTVSSKIIWNRTAGYD
jgi:DNA-binding transcriptional ArsR family regulator